MRGLTSVSLVQATEFAEFIANVIIFIKHALEDGKFTI